MPKDCNEGYSPLPGVLPPGRFVVFGVKDELRHQCKVADLRCDADEDDLGAGDAMDDGR